MPAASVLTSSSRADNLADVVAICRRLDGLPLAVELAAARIRLLSPAALLSRLDKALDIVSTSTLAPTRQKTLRDTIAWSYELLTAGQQTFFRRLAVFAGGADMAGLGAVAAPAELGDLDPLDIVGDLADASLVMITEGPDGEPRASLLQTIRAYAGEQLPADEADGARTAHAAHYLQVAERLESVRQFQHLQARAMAETELDNFREALGWTLQPSTDGPADARDVRTGLRLCAALGWVWYIGGYLAEGRRWFELAIERAGGVTFRRARRLPRGSGEPADSPGRGRTCPRARRPWRHDGTDAGLPRTRWRSDSACWAPPNSSSAISRPRTDTCEEALDLHRRLGNRTRLPGALGNLAGVEETLGNVERAEALTLEALSILRDLGDKHEATVQGQNLASLYVTAGRIDEAQLLAADLVDAVLELRSPNLTVAFVDTYRNILVRRGDPVSAAHLLGAEEAMRERIGTPNPYLHDELEETWALVRDTISVDDWQHHRELGRHETVEELLSGLRAARA